jgi:hypothetical protein
MRGASRHRRAVAVALVAFALAGCEVSATVDVRVRENGSGVIRLLVDADASAVKAAESGGVPLEQAVRLDDLVNAGWEVGDWVRVEDGSASIELSKPFESVDQVADIVEEASGSDGPLRGVRATREVGFLATKYGLTGDVDLAKVTTGVPTDPELLANLTAQSVDPAVIDLQLLAQVKSSFGLKIVARLPGAKPQTIVAEPGAATPIALTASVRDTKRLAFLVAAIALVLLAIALWMRGGRPRRRRASRPKPGPRGGPPRKRVPRSNVLHPHVPHPNLPHPHLPPNLPRPHMPGRSRPDAPAPPPRRPPMIPPGMT